MKTFIFGISALCVATNSVLGESAAIHPSAMLQPRDAFAIGTPELVGASEFAPLPDGTATLSIVPFRLDDASKAGLGAEVGAELARIASKQVQTKSYKVLDAEQLSGILKAKAFTGSITTEAGAIEAGNLSGTLYIVIGDVVKLEDVYMVTARLVDCLNGEIDAKYSEFFTRRDEVEGLTSRMVFELGLGLQASATGDAGVYTGQASWTSPSGIFESRKEASGVNVEVGTSSYNRSFIAKERVQLTVRVEGMDAYITILYRDSSGWVQRVYPNGMRPDNGFVKAGETLHVPPLGAESYDFEVQAPFGRSEFRVLATRVPLSLSAIDESPADAYGARSLGRIDGEQMQRVNGQWAQWIRDNPSGWAGSTMSILTAATEDDLRAPPPAINTFAGDANDAVFDDCQRVLSNLTQKPKLPTWFGTSSGSDPAANNPTFEAPDRLIVLYQPGRAPAATKDVHPRAQQLALTFPDVRSVPATSSRLTKSAAKTALEEQLRELNSDPDVLIAVPNYPLVGYGVASEPLSGSAEAIDIESVQWAKSNRYRPTIDVEWDASVVSGIDPVLIGVVDMGLDVLDARLRAFAWTNQGEIPNDGKDNDFNGFIDDYFGINPWYRNGDVAWMQAGGPKNGFNHGSCVSSIIAARKIGHPVDMEGMAPNARVLSAVALDPTSRSDLNALLISIDYAVRNGARVINLSLGGLYDGKDGRPPRAHFEQVHKLMDQFWPKWKHVLFVVAAGNDANNNDVFPVMPASLRYSNVLTVAAVDPEGRLARMAEQVPGGSRTWKQFSNFGASTVHTAAPGSMIIGIPGVDGATPAFGTSFAAPIVTAAAALVWGKDPSLTPEQVKQKIIEATTKIDELEGKVVSGGIINFRKLLEEN